jgi:Methyltransferase FkbM domain
VGLGATEAELPFFPPPQDNLGYASFVPGFVYGSEGEPLKLRIVPGDTYFPQNGIMRVDFIKMDIEGYEKQALAGLQETLRRYRPVVLMELSIDPALPELFKSLQELQSAFPENYEFFGFRERDRVSGAYRLHPFRPSFDQISQFNIVARPNEKAGKIPTMSSGESTRNP